MSHKRESLMLNSPVVSLLLPSFRQIICDDFQSDNDPTVCSFYSEMNDLSMFPIKTCSFLYSAENEVKMGFVFMLINIYDGTAI